MIQITISKKYKVHDNLTLLRGYTGQIIDETTSFYCIYCNELNRNVLVDKKVVVIN